jgi:ATP-dependent Lon protease
VLAAHPTGIKRIILPKANEKDLKDVPQEWWDELKLILVERIEEVLPAAFNQDACSIPPAERDEPKVKRRSVRSVPLIPERVVSTFGAGD